MGEAIDVVPRDMVDTVTRAREWMFDVALPFWAEAGTDRIDGGFVEHLALDGRDGGVPFKRVRAQARQIYVFAHAALLGWAPGRALAEHGWAFLQANGRTADGGWARTMGRQGDVLDGTCDAYDMAFVLFAHAWYFRLTADPAVLASAIATADVMDDLLAHPCGRGWHAAQGAASSREQNPHMHIVEAAIELAEATGHPRFRTLCDHVLDILRDHLIDAETGLLHEYYCDDWSRHVDPQEIVVEPGHMLEWSWILHRADRLLGTDVSALADDLYRRALQIGEREDGLVVDRADHLGRHAARSCRLWPQTEAMKGHLAMFEAGDVAAWDRALRCADNLFDRYLCGTPAGTWIDQLDADLQPAVTKIPSTSFYHLFLAFSELQRLAPLRQGLIPPRL